MPFVVIAAIAAGAAYYGFTYVAVSLVLSAVSQALQKNAKNPDPVVQSSNRTITIRQAISPWEVVLGRIRKGGIMTFRFISADQRFWHMVITLACHQTEEIDQVWAGDELLSLDANGNAAGKWAQTVIQPDATEQVVPDPPSIFVIFTVTSVQEVLLDVNGDGQFWQLHEVASAPTSIMEYAHPAPGHFVFHTGAIGKTAHIRTFNSTSNSFIRVKISKGDEDSLTQPFPDLVSESNGRWTNAHKQYGHTKVYIRLEANPDLFPFGVPNFTFVMRGANEVLDPRTDLTGYTANAALCLNWYLTNSEFGPGFDYATEVDEDDLITAANDADTAVPLAAGGSELRYTVNGAFSTSEQPKAVIERLLAACAGTLVDLGDKWRINMGVYHAPTLTLSERHLAGPSVINPYLPAREDANGVKGIFTNPNAHWQPDDFPAIEGSAYLAADGGKRKWLDGDWTAFITSITQVQRVAKIALLRIRQPLTEEATFNLTAWSAVPGRSVARTDAQLGFSAKAFEVLDSELAIVGEESPVLAVKLTLRETAAAIYDWSSSEEGFEDLAPNTDLPEVGFVPAPGAPEITEELYETREGRGVAARALITWTASDYPFAPMYQAEYKLTADSSYTVLPLTKGLTAAIDDVTPGTYDFRVKAIGASSVSSLYSTRLSVEIQGLGARPAAPTGVSLQRAGGAAIVTLTQHPELDVLRGGRILVRHTELTTGQTWEESTSIGMQDSWPGDSVVIFLPLKPGSYLLKARDSSGQESSSFASTVTKQASVLNFTTLATTLQEDTTFVGTHSNTVAAGGVLKLNVSGSAVLPDGVYTFAAGFDFTTVQRARITGQIEAVVQNVNDLIDSRTDLIDAWGDFDGTSGIGSGADCFLETRSTDDNPAGAPTWTAWERLDAGEYTCRGMQFRLQMRSFDPTLNIICDVLRVKADKV